MTIVIASRQPRHDRIAQAVRDAGHDVVLVRTPEELAQGAWKGAQPSTLFFTHWSHRIPAEVFEQHECIIFHTADLPQGRGGSPIQNHIVAGRENTSLCALRCVEDLDAGPVYLRRPISLLGTLDEILARAADLMVPMILEILERRPVPRPQEGEVSVFRRRRREDGDLSGLSQLREVFDHIRMLDGEGYPPAFLHTAGLVLEFSRASLKDGHVVADVKISRKSP